MKKAAVFLVGATWLTGKAAMAATKGLANGVRWGARGISNHREDIAGAASAVVRATGAAVEGAGRVVADGAQGVAAKADGAGSRAVARGAALVGRAVQTVGAGARKAAPTAGQMVAGGTSGAAGTVADALDSVAISEREIAALQQRLDKANRIIQARTREQRLRITDARSGRRKQELLDWLAVGGVSLSAMAHKGVPPEVEHAFALAYPRLAAQGTGFMEAVQSKSAPELLGLVNGVKGKLFETELVAHLNDGNLPAGMRASLATSATQPGYDLLITDRQGQVVDVLQAKATDSVAYVKSALERYPDIDVTTTTEVYAQLLALGVTDGVTDSGISEAVLQTKIEAVAQGGDGGAMEGWAPGSASVALLALSAFMDKSVSLEQRGAQFGQRAAGVGVTGVAGKAVLATTGYWWLGLAAGVGARVLAQYGGGKRARLESLRAMVFAAEQVAERLQKQVILALRTKPIPIPKIERRREALPDVVKAAAAATQTRSPSLHLPDPMKAAASVAPAQPTLAASALAIRRVSAEQTANVTTLTARDVVHLRIAQECAQSKRARRMRVLLSALGLAVGLGWGIWKFQTPAPTATIAASATVPPDPKAQVEAELKSIMDDAIKRYPYLSTTAGLKATREMLAERDRRLRLGESPQDALHGAVQMVAPKHLPKSPRESARP